MIDECILLEAKALQAGRSGRALFEAIDFRISGGEALLLRGPNGAGKSSLLATLLGEFPAYAGSFKLHPQAAPLALAIANAPPPLPQSVREFVASPLRLVGARAAPADSVDRALEFSGLQLQQRSSIHQLSRGQWQRLLFARAHVLQPRLLLADEPESGLDAQGMAVFNRLIQTILQSGGGVLAAVHGALPEIRHSGEIVLRPVSSTGLRQ
ncbi:MAG: ATP-binding cassette domain-containing protein [Leptospirales bacterium]|nr:ATP-binding cassette domain-containing protein [Leptospirales bacterium]